MATRTVANLTAVISANNTKFKKGIGGAQKSLGGFQSAVKSIGPTIAAAFSVGVITSFTKSVIDAYDVQAKAEQNLLTALKGREDAQKNLIKQAQELQKVTLFGDEETIRAQALIAAFVKEESQIRKVIPLVQDLATAKGMDLAGAADLVSKTLGSSTNALSRYGIQVEGAVGSVERLESLMRGLNDAFGGQAEAAAKVGSGVITQFKNVVGDLKEEVGEVVIKAADLNTKLERLITIISNLKIVELAEKFKTFRTENERFIKLLEVAYMPINAYNKLVLEGVKAAGELGKELGKNSKNNGPNLVWIETINEAGIVVRSLVGAVQEGSNTIPEANKKVAKSFENVNEEALEYAGWMSTLFYSGENTPFGGEIEYEDWMGELFVEGISGWTALAEAGSEASEKLKNSMVEIKDESKELSDIMSVEFAHIGSSFASSMGQVAAGAKTMEEALSDMGKLIADALGDILITVGLSTSPIGIPFILAGLAIKGISSFAGAGGFSGGGKGSDFTPIPKDKYFSTQHKSILYGNNIQTATEYSTSLYNQVG
jgi:hypothetical protein